MKHSLLVIICIILTFSLKAQKIENDTLPSKRAIKSNWAVKLESGAVLHQMFSPRYMENKISQITGITVFYKKFYWTYDVFSYEFKPYQEMTFDDVTVGSDDEFYTFNFNTAIGYSYDINTEWSADIKIGLNTASYEISNGKETGLIYESDLLTGPSIGVGIDRYIKLKRFNFLLIGFGVDYYMTDYSKVSPELKSSSISYSLTIGYKGFFRKVLD